MVLCSIKIIISHFKKNNNKERREKEIAPPPKKTFFKKCSHLIKAFICVLYMLYQ